MSIGEEIAFLRRSATALRQIARIERHLLTRLTDLADQLEAQAEELKRAGSAGTFATTRSPGNSGPAGLPAQ